MRKLEYLSPSSISKYREDKVEFYLTYLADIRAPRFPQTLPMSVGSSFDAFVKSFLHKALFGDNDPKFDLQTLFEAQVEPQNRDWAWKNGQQAFNCYKNSGALSDLMLDLQGSICDPRFEIEVRGTVEGHREGITKQFSDLVLLGKPDVYYINRENCPVILDFKVNGWCSRSAVSPLKGYIRIRSGSNVSIVGGPHKDCIPMSHRGSYINCAYYLEDLEDSWASQLAIYGWLCGAPVGSDFITAIDQMVCKPTKTEYPEVRVAAHRLRIKSDYQWKLLAEAQEIWETVHSDHFFRDLSLEDSKNKCDSLEKQAQNLKNPATEEDKMFNALTRG